jgi:hypothetical protein
MAKVKFEFVLEDADAELLVDALNSNLIDFKEKLRNKNGVFNQEQLAALENYTRHFQTHVYDVVVKSSTKI